MNSRFLHIYDFLLVKGGAEAVAIDLCRDNEQLDLLVSFVEQSNYPIVPLPPGRLLNLNRRWRHPVALVLFISRAFSKTKLTKKYEKVLYSGSYGPLAVFNRQRPGNILYCHTPPRFLYDLKNYYLKSVPFWQRPFLRLLIYYLKPRYESAIQKMDLIIANSKNVQVRISKYLGKNSVVIYPPCDTEKYQWIGQQDYYLSTARLEKYKRVELVVEAFKSMPEKRLIVASSGTQLDKLILLAGNADNIEFTGWCSQEKLTELMGNAIATLYLPVDEDFGLSPVESMSAGKPVIGVNEGGVRETVIDGETGLLCPADPTTDDIIECVQKLTPELSLNMRAACQQRAKKFARAVFFSKMNLVFASKNNDLKDLNNHRIFDDNHDSFTK